MAKFIQEKTIPLNPKTLQKIEESAITLIDNIKSKLIAKYPFLAIPFSKLKFILDWGFPGIAGVSTPDGENFYCCVNPVRIFYPDASLKDKKTLKTGSLKLEPKDVVFVILHELQHLALHHIYLPLEKDYREKYDHKLMNIAMDLKINEGLVRDKDFKKLFPNMRNNPLFQNAVTLSNNEIASMLKKALERIGRVPPKAYINEVINEWSSLEIYHLLGKVKDLMQKQKGQQSNDLDKALNDAADRISRDIKNRQRQLGSQQSSRVSHQQASSQPSSQGSSQQTSQSINDIEKDLKDALKDVKKGFQKELDDKEGEAKRNFKSASQKLDKLKEKIKDLDNISKKGYDRLKGRLREIEDAAEASNTKEAENVIRKAKEVEKELRKKLAKSMKKKGEVESFQKSWEEKLKDFERADKLRKLAKKHGLNEDTLRDEIQRRVQDRIAPKSPSLSRNLGKKIEDQIKGTRAASRAASKLTEGVIKEVKEKNRGKGISNSLFMTEDEVRMDRLHHWWRRVLRHVFDKILSKLFKGTYTKISKRLQALRVYGETRIANLRSFIMEKDKSLLVYVLTDTSGSISMGEWISFGKELYNLLRNVKNKVRSAIIVFLPFSDGLDGKFAKILFLSDIKRKNVAKTIVDLIKIRSIGGTDLDRALSELLSHEKDIIKRLLPEKFKPFCDKIIKCKNKLLVIFTDGEVGPISKKNIDKLEKEFKQTVCIITEGGVPIPEFRNRKKILMGYMIADKIKKI